MANDNDNKQPLTNPPQLGAQHDDGDLTLREAFARFERGLPACFQPAGEQDRICVVIVPMDPEQEDDDGSERG